MYVLVFGSLLVAVLIYAVGVKVFSASGARDLSSEEWNALYREEVALLMELRARRGGLRPGAHR